MLVNNGYDVCHNNCLTCNIVVNRHALPDRPVHSDTNSASLGSIGSDCHLSNGCLTLTPPGCQSRTMCAVFGLGVFGLARRHALVSLRHAAPPSAMLPLITSSSFNFFKDYYYNL